MYEREVSEPQPTGQAETLDGIAEGIMAMMEEPNSSGEVHATRQEPAPKAEEEPQEAADEPEAEEDAEPESGQKYVIKWQGQEKEVTQEELISLAQQGFDYTKKTQALAEERDQLAPYQGLAKQIQANPHLAQQIAAIMAGQQPQQEPKAPEKPTFDDPIEQLKWEMKQEAIAEVRKELIPIHRQQALTQIRTQLQADPDYREVHQQIVEMVKAQPPAVQRNLYLQLDQDPQAYMEAFQHFKNIKAQKGAEATNQEPPKPKPVQKQTHAPILEAGGVAPQEAVISKAQTERITKMKAKALRSGDPTQLADWLSASGAIDHLY